VVLDQLTVRSLAIDGSRGIATLRGTGVETPSRRRGDVTVALSSHSGVAACAFDSNGYYKAGSLLSGSIMFTRGAARWRETCIQVVKIVAPLLPLGPQV
jgi:hypothetical protein